MYKAHIDRVVLANARALARTHMMITRTSNSIQIGFRSETETKLSITKYNWNVFFFSL